MMEESTRRDFLRKGVAAGAGIIIASSSGIVRGYPANEKLRVASVGAGGRAEGDIGGVSGEQIVALCDVDDDNAKGIYRRFPKVNKYRDFREMLDKEEKNIDAVIVATPDHTHAVASIKAMRMGKHCYTEKPLTHNVFEARLMRETAIKHKVQTSMGNQGTASNGLRQGAEIVQSGAIGKVREVHIWTNRPVWPQATEALLLHQGAAAAITGKGEAAKPRDSIAWDLWLGPAQYRPYDPIYAPFKWRGWWDFGTGALGDMACHTMNLPYMALKLGSPKAVEVMAVSEVNDQTFPFWSRIKYEFPVRGDMPEVSVIWYDGGPKTGNLPPADLFEGGKPASSGSLMIGDSGKLYSPGDYGEDIVLLPKKSFEGYQPPSPTIPRSPGHHAEWIRAAKGGPPAMANFIDYAVGLTEMVLLGNVAMRAQHRIEYDIQNMKIPNHPKAEQYLSRDYRKGWNPTEI
jgi:predicted dehydrogenase